MSVEVERKNSSNAEENSQATLFGNKNGSYLAALFVRENGLFMRPTNKGRFYHDGRFATLLDVVNHYNTRFSLGLTAQEKHDLVEYLKSLPSDE